MEPLVSLVTRSACASDAVRVLIAEGNNMLRLGVRTVLGREPDILVVGEAANRNELLATVSHHRPDVIILNVLIPGMGLTIPSELMRVSRVVVVTEIDDSAAIIQAMAAGALSYLVYGQFETSLLPVVVRHAAMGRLCLTPAVTAAVVHWFRRGSVSVHSTLTDRQREVMDLLAEGLSNKDIADHLAVSIKTVKNHLHQAFKHLDVSDRHAAGMVWRGGLCHRRLAS